MDMRFLKQIVPAAALGLALLLAPACRKTSVQSRFATPDEAATTLLEALKSDNLEKMRAIFGREAMESAASGDPVSDRNDRAVLALAMVQSWRWAPLGEDRQELIIGDEQWPFPVPLIKTGGEWQFDSQAGLEEVLARRIGRNEIGVIGICRAYVGMQREYASRPHDGKPAGLFAQRLRSTAGRQDGLYWPVGPGAKPSPLGDLAAEAAAEGYDQNRTPASPFWGYRFRILTAQGPAALGGKKSYVVNGDMKGGFALLAYPAQYASSGVMTFMVGDDGVIFQKDLGTDTATQAAGLAEYNPDASWTRVRLP
jgi:hypothetical protein